MEMIISGFGGQGVLTAGLVSIYAGNAMGKQVCWSPSYGSEMRGGTANCCVSISDEEIGSPSLPECDVLIAMNEPSLDKFADAVRNDGIIVVNNSIVPKDYKYPEGVSVYKVDATEIANEVKNPRGINLIMLGALLKATDMFTVDFLAEQADAYFAEKGKKNPLNAQCIALGYEKAER